MNTKTLFIIILLILAVTIIPSVIILNNPAISKVSAKNLEECKTLSYNGDDKTNIVFFSSQKEAETYSDFLLSFPPFKENKKEFNFYYIDSYSPKCELYKGIALFCYSKELVKKSASCPNDFIIVIKDKPNNIRSSNYMNVLSINKNLPQTVMLHEFGHSFSNLADEYTPATIPRNSKNCASKCENFPIKNGCFQGCGKEKYYRSIDNGIMRTLHSDNYGILNEKLILEKINKKSKITGFQIKNKKNCVNEKYYLIEGVLENNKINILDKTIEPGCVGNNGAGDFNYRLIFEDNSFFTENEFNPELIYTDSQQPSQTQIEGGAYISDKPFLLKVPIIPKSKSLEILRENKKLSEINLQNIGATACKIK